MSSDTREATHATIREPDRRVELLDRLECTDLLHRYFGLVDAGTATSATDLFCHEATWSLGKTTTRGLPELHAILERREAETSRVSRHVCTNMTFPDAAGAEGPAARAYLTVYRHDGDPRAAAPDAALTTPVFVGDVLAEFCPSGSRWVIHSLQTIPIFLTP